MGMFKERRRGPRELAGLHGTYLWLTRRELGWHDCSLVDVSGRGAGMRFRGPTPELGDEVLIQLDEPNAAAAIQLRGTVRHVRPDFFGAARAGVEFAALDPDQRQALLSLLRGERV
jgi:c-di-GMP-binding flagellar brake protein YcgR